ncbi:hypothetical protein FACS189441_6640 [Betaproteobacteria bacterium]|nr:hypothetical protein FACS189441_6640 [Betaproteobacteria bacterium]
MKQAHPLEADDIRRIMELAKRADCSILLESAKTSFIRLRDLFTAIQHAEEKHTGTANLAQLGYYLSFDFAEDVGWSLVDVAKDIAEIDAIAAAYEAPHPA